MSHVSAVLGRIRSARRSPVPPVASVSSSHLAEAATVLLRAVPLSGPLSGAGDLRRAPAASGWAPAGAFAVPLWAGQPGPTTWFG